MLTGINCILFDMDGTLTKPTLDFNAMKAEMGVPDGISILEYIENTEKPDTKIELQAILDKHELEAAENTVPNTGFQKLTEFLNSRD